MNTQDEIKYQEALKRVKKIKGFYTHAIVYVFVNIMIVFINVKNFDPGETYFLNKNLQRIAGLGSNYSHFVFFSFSIISLIFLSSQSFPKNGIILKTPTA